jgi:hypothetical protein
LSAAANPRKASFKLILLPGRRQGSDWTKSAIQSTGEEPANFYRSSLPWKFD